MGPHWVVILIVSGVPSHQPTWIPLNQGISFNLPLVGDLNMVNVKA